jgi:hypothetical protein
MVSGRVAAMGRGKPVVVEAAMLFILYLIRRPTRCFFQMTKVPFPKRYFAS